LFGAISGASFRPRTALIGVGLRRAAVTELADVLAMPALAAVVTFLRRGFPARARRRAGDRQDRGGASRDERTEGPIHIPSMGLTEAGVNLGLSAGDAEKCPAAATPARGPPGHSLAQWLRLLVVQEWSIMGNPTDFTFHAETRAEVHAPPDRVFALIDDHARLSAHMNRSSWQMGGGKMETVLDEGDGRRVGSHIRMHARVLGIGLSLDEVVTVREAPWKKIWETVGSPRLIVIGAYRMGFEITENSGRSLLRVFIDYALPDRWPGRWLGRLFGGYYARWCTKSMVADVGALLH